jgi:hypothetical protein
MALGIVACSADDEAPAEDGTSLPTTSVGTGGTSTGDSTVSAGTVDTTVTSGPTDSGPIFDVGAGTGGEGDGCSGDLQSVIDTQTGALIEICAPDQGCHMGECIEACMAAALSEGSIGCDYLAPYPPFYENEDSGSSYDGSCHALMIANTWGRPAQLMLERNGVMYDAQAHARIPNGVGPAVTYDPVPPTGIPVGQVAILFLSHVPTAQHSQGASLACPVTPAYVGDAAAHGTAQGVAFELSSDTPITVYDIVPFGGAESWLPSASLLLPTSAWGDNYVLAAPHSDNRWHAKWALVIARDDATTVTINTNANVMGGSIVAPTPGDPTSYMLDAGQYVQFASTGESEFGGDIVEATGDVGVYTGHTYLNVHTDDSYGGPQDSSHQQITHVQSLASEYVGAGIPTRLASLMAESVVYRVVGVVDDTTLSYDPAPPIGAPTTLNVGDVVEFESRDLFIVASQDDDHPFAFTQYMSGSISDGTLGGCFQSPCTLGDTDWINLVPPAQFLSRYAFFIDPTYGVTTVAVTRTRGPNGFADVDIACMGAVTGWMPVGNSTEYEVAHVDLHRGGVGPCATSQQEASSPLPFGLTVWGLDRDASYGYPAGGNARVINSVNVPAG